MGIDSFFSKKQFNRTPSVTHSHEEFTEFAEAPLPMGKNEDWKYTDLATIDFTPFAPFDSAYAPSFVSQGCATLPLRSPFDWAAGDKLEAAIKAFASSITRVTVPSEKKAKLQALFSLHDSAAVANEIVLEPGSALDYYEEYSSGPRPLFFGCKTRFTLGEDAVLNYYPVQRFGDNVFSLVNKEFFLGKNARANSVQAELGGAFSRVKLEQHFVGDGSAAAIHKTMFFGSGNQQFDLTTNAFHEGKNTKSDIIVKGALSGHASSVYRGLIRIEKEASGTDSFLQDRVLHLSKGVRSNSIPSLKIDNHNVRASHGATVSKLNEESLFYLASRGLPRPQAQRLVVEGFLHDVVKGIPETKVLEGIALSLSLKLGGV